MKLYSENENYKLYHGNMLDMLEVIEPNTIDSVVTDPPYGLTSITKRFGKEGSAPASTKNNDGSFARLSKGFMGKEWDGSGIEYNIDTWQKCYEVLKPGGYLLAFGGSRTFHRIACAIEDAGFEIRDTIMWLYGSGFPKSMDISKQIDKKGGNDYSKQFAKDLKQARESRNLTMKYCDDKYCNSSTNWSWYEGRKDGCRVPDYKTYLEIIKEFPELEKYRELIKEAEREVIGKKEYTNDKNVMNISNYNGERVYLDITIPSTDLAKQWQGWGTALKPSYESIIVARKPFKGSLVDNVIENGVGGINIDECRVEHNEPIKTTNRVAPKSDGTKMGKFKQNGILASPSPSGRFPANTILTYDEKDFDEVCGGFPNTKSTPRTPTIGGTGGVGQATNFQRGSETSYFNDSGSASRYFYCAKASKRDRDEGLPNKWLDSLELILYNNIGDELWKDKITIKEESKAKHLEDMVASLKKVIEEYGIQTKKDIDLNTLLYGKKSLEKYLKENKYTTKMEISSTTISQILNLLTLYTIKENTQGVSLEITNGGNLVEIVGNSNQLQIIIKENRELVRGANNVVLKMLLKINEKEGHNEHCTVKPTSLMQYLVRLVTPNGGIILDPFNGSGSTGKAVMYENHDRNKDYKYIGIELTEEYLPIAQARIEYVCNLKKKNKRLLMIL